MHPGDHSTSIAPSEVSRHKSRQSCWMILHGKVYDLTSFLNQHPGGATILLKNAGRDATEEFDAFHSIDTLQNHLPAEYAQPIPESLRTKAHRDFNSTLLGKAAETQRLPTKPTDGAEVRQSQSVTNSGSRLRRIINISDFERAAFQALSKKAFAFFSAGADAGLTTAWNASAWQAIRFRPRVLKPIREVNLSQTILGIPFSAPFFIAPAGGGKLAHRSGEILMTRAAAKHGILQWVCNNAGCSQKEMADIRGEGQILYWQIYAMTDLAKSKREIREAISAGYRGFTLTVDAIIPGKREKDMRQSIAELEELEEPCQDDTDTDGLTGGISVSRPMVYTEFDWVTAIKWLRGITDLPIAVKGIQCWEDAAKCMQYGAHPWLSNHGGRQLEGAPSAAETLLEIREHCPEIFQNCEVIVDGGITKGTDIVKALALGATAVGIGRGFLYALTFGEAGVSRAIHILKQEMQTTMTLLGVTSIDQLCLSHVDASGLVYAASSAKPRL